MNQKITIRHYFDKKGELHRNESIYNSKGEFVGWFHSFDMDNFLFVNVRTIHEKIEPAYIEDFMVEIECTPIYVAL